MGDSGLNERCPFTRYGGSPEPVSAAGAASSSASGAEGPDPPHWTHCPSGSGLGALSAGRWSRFATRTAMSRMSVVTRAS